MKKSEQELIAEGIGSLSSVQENNGLVRGRNSGDTVRQVDGPQDPESHATRQVWKAARKMSPEKVSALKDKAALRLKSAKRDLDSADRQWKEGESEVENNLGKDWQDNVRTPDDVHSHISQLADQFNSAHRKFHTLRAIHAGLEKAHAEHQKGTKAPVLGEAQTPPDALKPDVDPKDPYEMNKHVWHQHGRRELAQGSVGNVKRAAQVALDKIEKHQDAHRDALSKGDSKSAEKHALEVKKHQGAFDGLMASLDKPTKFGKPKSSLKESSDFKHPDGSLVGPRGSAILKAEKDFHKQGLDVAYHGEERGFSHRKCEMCGSHLGGDRITLGLLKRQPKGQKHVDTIEACHDCVNYVANGELPHED